MRRILPILLLAAVPAFAQAYDNGRVNVGHKVGHFAVGFGIAWGFGVAGHHKTGLALGIGLGIAKEVYDHRHSDETWVSQKRDVLITSAGALLGYAVSRHFWPHGADLDGGHSDLASMTPSELMDWDRREQAFDEGVR